MMTREEAIINLQVLLTMADNGRWDTTDATEAVKVAISALCPVSREQVERVWRGCSWCNNEGKKPENWECSLLDDRGFSVVTEDEVVWTNAEFCPVCGKPLTDEAVQMVMERMDRCINLT